MPFIGARFAPSKFSQKFLSMNEEGSSASRIFFHLVTLRHVKPSLLTSSLSQSRQVLSQKFLSINDEGPSSSRNFYSRHATSRQAKSTHPKSFPVKIFPKFFAPGRGMVVNVKKIFQPSRHSLVKSTCINPYSRQAKSFLFSSRLFKPNPVPHRPLTPNR